MRSMNPLCNLTATTASLAATLRIMSISTIGISRSRWLLGTFPPDEVLALLLEGRLPVGQPEPVTEVLRPMIQKWRDALREQDVDDLVARNTQPGHMIMDAGHELWPFPLDPDPPVLLFVRGNPELLSAGRRVAVVGTRRCSAVGRNAAREIGWTLAEAGVVVASGLALGIDTAVHQGAGTASLRAGRVGVVASGLDMVYPTRNARLWSEIGTGGVLITETPMGERATRWRFPARNRLIAGLSELVVVVESHEKGGALITADEAIVRGVDVVAMPGSVQSPSCAGTNQLLMDGVAPVRNGQDICDILGVSPKDRDPDGAGSGGNLLWGAQLDLAGSAQPARQDAGQVSRSSLSDIERRLVDEVSAGAVHLDQLNITLELSIPRLLGLTQRLGREGHVKVDGSMIGPAGLGD